MEGNNITMSYTVVDNYQGWASCYLAGTQKLYIFGYDNQVRVYNSDNSYVSYDITGVSTNAAQAVYYQPWNSILFPRNNNSLSAFNLTTNTFTTNYTQSVYGFTVEACSVTTDGTYLYVAIAGTLGRIDKYNSSGTLVTASWVPANSSTSYSPKYMLYDGTYIYRSDGNQIGRIVVASGVYVSNWITFSTLDYTGAPVDPAIAIDSNYLYIGLNNAQTTNFGQISQYNKSTGALANSIVFSFPTSTSGSVSLLMSDGTYLYIQQGGNNSLLKMTPPVLTTGNVNPNITRVISQANTLLVSFTGSSNDAFPTPFYYYSVNGSTFANTGLNNANSNIVIKNLPVANSYSLQLSAVNKAGNLFSSNFTYNLTNGIGLQAAYMNQFMFFQRALTTPELTIIRSVPNLVSFSSNASVQGISPTITQVYSNANSLTVSYIGVQNAYPAPFYYYTVSSAGTGTLTANSGTTALSGNINITNLTVAGNYSIQLTAVNPAGNVSSTTSYGQPYVIGSSPNIISVANLANSLSVSFQGVSNWYPDPNYYYSITGDILANYVQVNVSSNAFTIPNLTTSGSRTVYVFANNLVGRKYSTVIGTGSPFVLGTTAPNITQVQSGANSLVVSFAGVLGANPAPFYYYSVNGSVFSNTGLTTNGTFTVPGLTVANTYTVQLAAVNPAGNVFSNLANGQPFTLGTTSPSITNIYSDINSIIVQYSGPTDAYTAPFYYYSLNSGTAANTAVNATSGNITIPTTIFGNNTIQLIAVNPAGNVVSVSANGQPYLVGTRPNIISVTPQANSLVVSFNLSANSYTNPDYYYSVSGNTNPSSYVLIPSANITLNPNTFVISGLTSNVAAVVSLLAINPAGNVYSATTVTQTPYVVGTNSPSILNVYSNVNSLLVSFAAVQNSNPVPFYYYSVSGGIQNANSGLQSNVGGNLYIPNLSVYGNYAVSITAVSPAGNLTSEIAYGIPYVVGTQPNIISVSNLANSLAVSFQGVSNWYPPPTYYYSVSGNVAANYVQANVSGNAFTISNLTVANTYTVYLYATNLAGNSYSATTGNGNPYVLGSTGGIINVNNTSLIINLPLTTDANNTFTSSGITTTSDANVATSTATTVVGGGSMYFNASNVNGISCLNPNSILFNQYGITIAFWLKITPDTITAASSAPYNMCRVYNFNTSASTFNPWLSFFIYGNGGSFPARTIGFTNWWTPVVNLKFTPDDNWHHYCYVLQPPTTNGSNNGNYAFYVDGVLDPSGSGTMNVYSSRWDACIINNAFIGRGDTNAGPLTSAYMNQLLFYKRPITIQELNTIYNYPAYVTFTNSISISQIALPRIIQVYPSVNSLTIQYSGVSDANPPPYYYYTISSPGTGTITANSGSNATSGNITISNLTVADNYTIQLTAVNLAGNVVSASVNGQPYILGTNVPNITQIQSNANSLVVSFTGVQNANPVPFYYYSVNGSVFSNTGLNDNGTFTIPGLTVANTYSVQLMAVNSAGNVLSATVDGQPYVLGTTLPNITQVQSNANSLIVSFTGPQDAYTTPFYYYSVNGSTVFSNTGLNDNGTFTISGLTVANTYSVQLMAVNPAGNVLSATVNGQPYVLGTTLPNITQVQSDVNSLVVSFTGPQDAYTAPFYYYSVNGSVFSNTGFNSNATFTISGLNFANTYAVQLMAVNPAGNVLSATANGQPYADGIGLQNAYMNQFLFFQRALTAEELTIIKNAPDLFSFTSNAAAQGVSPTITQIYSNANSLIVSYIGVQNAYPAPFYYYTVSSAETGTTTANSGTNALSGNITITNLTVSGNYSVQLIAVNPAGNVSSATAYGQPYVLGTALPNITQIQSNANSLVLSFTGAVGAFPQPFYYYSVNGGVFANTGLNANATFVIENLTVIGNYRVQLLAVNPAGNLISGNSYGLPYVLGTAAPNITKVQSNINSLIVSFTGSQNAYPEPYYYYSVNGGVFANTGLNGNGNVVIPGLTTFGNYSVQILATNIAGNTLSGTSYGQPYVIGSTSICNVNNANLFMNYQFNKDLLDYSTGTGVNAYNVSGTVSYVAGTGANTILGNGAAFFGPTNLAGFQPVQNITVGTNGATAATWIKLTSLVPTLQKYTRIFEFVNSVSGLPFFSLQFDASFTNVVVAFESGAVFSYPFAVDTNWHHYSVIVSPSGSFTLYIDNVARLQNTYGNYSTSFANQINSCYVGGTNAGLNYSI